MMFWRKKKNQKDQELEKQEDRLLHRKDDPEIEPPVEYDSELNDNDKHLIEDPAFVNPAEIDAEPVPAHTPLDDNKEKQDLSDHTEEGGWLNRLTGGLQKSSTKLTTGLGDLFTKRKLDDAAKQDLEDILITADLGPVTANKLVEEFASKRFGKEISEEEIKEALAEQITQILEPVSGEIAIKKPENGPFTILMCGVNGVGKTTTIGKLAAKFMHDHHSVMLAAGDTFRAAAVEQLKVWGERTHCPVIAKDIGSDAAAVAFEAMEEAKQKNTDVLMIDTAGRLQNKKNLMEELQKIIRVIKKADETAPHLTLLVLDATTGQNAHSQVETFKEMVDINGLIVTKLDGSAKGGVVVSLADKFGIPIYAVGVGETADDLNPFSAKEYAHAIMGVDQ